VNHLILGCHEGLFGYGQQEAGDRNRVTVETLESSGSGRGSAPEVVVLDEVANHGEDLSPSLRMAFCHLPQGPECRTRSFVHSVSEKSKRIFQGHTGGGLTLGHNFEAFDDLIRPCGTRPFGHNPCNPAIAGRLIEVLGACDNFDHIAVAKPFPRFGP